MEKKNYDASSIMIFRDLSAVRIRPGMYIGDLHYAIKQMFLEALDNSVDEFMAGYCKEIRIYISSPEKLIEVEDNGRGIPVDIHKEEGIPAVQLIFTTLHSGGKFSSDSYQYSGGLHGVGISVVNALAEHLTVEVNRNMKKYSMKFKKGEMIQPLEEVGTSTHTGTLIRFTPDYDILKDSTFPTLSEIEERLEELSFLNPGLKINLRYDNSEKVFFSESGVIDYLKRIEKREFLLPIITLNNDRVKVAFDWTSHESEKILSFTNNIKQLDGGTHTTGFKSAVSRAMLSYITANLKPKVEITADDVRSGLCAILAIYLKDPQFSSQTKNKLVSAEARSLVESFVLEGFKKWLEENPNESKILAKRIINAAELREATNKLKENLKKGSDVLTLLSGKLVDCAMSDSNPELCEIFLVEGESAAGSGKTVKNKNQALYAFNGKLLNVARATKRQIFSYEAILGLIAALGTGVEEDFDINKLRYHKIIIMTDADVDGMHIRSLLLTFFLKLFPGLIESGKVMIARAPLFKVHFNRKHLYIKDDNALEEFLSKRIIDNAVFKSGGKVLNEQEIKEIINKCNKFVSDFDGVRNPAIEDTVLSLSITHDLFNNQKKCIDYINKALNATCETKLDKSTGKIELSIETLYGILKYYISPVNIEKLDIFPLEIDGENIYEPLRLKEILAKKAYEGGISIQRYKGLGEMNAEELWETCLNPDNRNLDVICLNEEDREISFRIVSEIMGDEIENRRDFVLDSINTVILNSNVHS